MLHPSYDPATDKMKIRQISTGLVSERSMPDARDMVGTGLWEFVDWSTPSIREILESRRSIDLSTIAGRELKGDADVHHLINHILVPQIEAGTLILP